MGGGEGMGALEATVEQLDIQLGEQVQVSHLIFQSSPVYVWLGN